VWWNLLTKRKWILLFGLISLIVLIASIIGIYFYHEAVKIQSWVLDYEKLKAVEQRFRENPTLEDCIYILDNYSFLKKYKKTISVAEKCLSLGAKDFEFAWLIHLRLAKGYKELGEPDEAYKHIMIALEIDRKGQIKKGNWLESLGLKEMIGREQRE
jgi:tetratricopeptide (TPR) repeat protein